jgi:multicomponent K+:H+ antiporter subunit G
MTGIADLPPWAALLTAILLLLGSTVTLIGSLGLLRLKSFYERVHAPTLGMTLGTVCILAASILYFSVQQSRPVVHEVLIIVFTLITTPITLMVLVRAALLRGPENRYVGPRPDVPSKSSGPGG